MSENTATTKPETEPSMCSVICARVLRERRCVAKPGRDHIRSYCSGPGDERSVATNSTVRDLCCDLDALDELIEGMIGQLEIYERRLKEPKEDASLSRTPPGMSDATANISLAAKAIIGSLPEPNAIGQVAKLVSDLALVANILTRRIDALEALARTPEREVHDPLCSVGQQAGDQTMPCDCARPSPSTPEGTAETACVYCKTPCDPNGDYCRGCRQIVCVDCIEVGRHFRSGPGTHMEPARCRAMWTKAREVVVSRLSEVDGKDTLMTGAGYGVPASTLGNTQMAVEAIVELMVAFALSSAISDERGRGCRSITPSSTMAQDGPGKASTAGMDRTTGTPQNES